MRGEGLEVVACDLCGSQGPGEPLFLNYAERPEEFPLGPGSLVQCGQCGFVYVPIRPREERLFEMYAEADTEKYTRFLEMSRLLYEKELSRIERVLGDGRGKRMLDIGGGLGTLLAMAGSRGFVPYLVEPNRSAREVAAQGGLGQIFEDCFQLPIEGDFFDVVVMMYVLEHVARPSLFLSRACELLKRGGLLVVKVPNFAFWGTLRYKVLRNSMKPGLIVNPEHLNYFTHHTLRSMLERAGFSAIRLEFSYTGSILYTRIQAGGLWGRRSIDGLLRVADLLGIRPMLTVYAVK